MPNSPAWQRFIDSTVMDYDKWHDGEPYDLSTLSEMTRAELDAAIAKVQAGEDWRDIETLAAIAAMKDQSPDAARRAMQILEDQSRTGQSASRLRAAKCLQELGQQASIADDVVAAIDSTPANGAITQVLELAKQNPTEAVKLALLRAARDKPGPFAVHAAALLYFHAGLAKEAFDWSHRPYFLRFNPENDAERADHMKAFNELCEKLKVDPKSV